MSLTKHFLRYTFGPFALKFQQVFYQRIRRDLKYSAAVVKVVFDQKLEPYIRKYILCWFHFLVAALN